jgi:uncharacterized membrane protein
MSRSETEVETGKAVDRIAGFSDAVFAFAMTLLAIGITVPEVAGEMTETRLSGILVGLIPNILSYFVCFFSVGLYWVVHHRMFRYVKRSDNGLIWINLALMLFVAFTPFPSSLLIRFGDLSVAWTVFAATMGTVGILSTRLWAYVTDEHRLVGPHLDQELVKLILRRDVSPPFIFFVSIFISMLSPTAAELFTLGMIPVLHNLINRRYHNRTGRKLS